jgi:O-antigen ligase
MLFYFLSGPNLLIGLTGGGRQDSSINIYQYFMFALTQVIFWIIRIKRQKIQLVLPPSFLIAIVWFAVTIVWSDSPMISARRVFLFLASSYVFVATGSNFSSIRICKMALSAILLVLILNYAAVAMGMGAHTDSDFDGALAGSWHGIFLHKNAAGAFLAPAIIFVYWYPRPIAAGVKWCSIAMLTVFLIKSNAKMAMIDALAFTLPLSLVLRLTTRLVFMGMFAILAAACIAFAIANYAQMPPTAFTGRAYIWQILVPFAQDHLWLGVGYGAFWGIGDSSRIFSLTKSFVTRMTEGHNGYLDMVLTTGIPGLFLAVYSGYIEPLFKSCHLPDKRIGNLCIALILVNIVQNFTESVLFTVDFPSWTFILLALIFIHRSREHHASL